MIKTQDAIIADLTRTADNMRRVAQRNELQSDPLSQVEPDIAQNNNTNTSTDTLPRGK